MASLGLVYSLASGVVTRIINPDKNDGDAHLDRVEAGLHPGMGLHRIAKEDVGADERNCPAVEVLIAFANASKTAPPIPLCEGKRVAVIDPSSNVVGFLLGCPTLINDVFVPEKHGPDFKAVEITDAKKPTTDIKGKATALPVTVGSKYDPGTDKFEATADQISVAVANADKPGEKAPVDAEAIKP